MHSSIVDTGNATEAKKQTEGSVLVGENWQDLSLCQSTMYYAYLTEPDNKQVHHFLAQIL